MNNTLGHWHWLMSRATGPQLMNSTKLSARSRQIFGNIYLPSTSTHFIGGWARDMVGDYVGLFMKDFKRVYCPAYNWRHKILIIIEQVRRRMFRYSRVWGSRCSFYLGFPKGSQRLRCFSQKAVVRRLAEIPQYWSSNCCSCSKRYPSLNKAKRY